VGVDFGENSSTMISVRQHGGAKAFRRRAVQLERFAMKDFALKIRRFLASEDGPTAVEYAVMLALIIIVCLTAINSIGTNANTTFESVAAELAP
jgi:pilus assembly protein Flp/PilA